MEKLATSKSLIVAIITILLALSSCGQANYNTLLGKETLYSVYHKKPNETFILLDTLTITPAAPSKSYFLHKNTIVFSYDSWDKKYAIKEWTGADDGVNHFGFHFPRSSDYTFMAILPFPSMTIPPNITLKKTITMSIMKSNYKALQGKVVKQRLDVVGKKDSIINGANRVVYIQQGENLNLVEEEGKYTCEYHFNEELGYVFLKFVRPNGEIMEWRKIYP